MAEFDPRFTNNTLGAFLNAGRQQGTKATPQVIPGAGNAEYTGVKVAPPSVSYGQRSMDAFGQKALEAFQQGRNFGQAFRGPPGIGQIEPNFKVVGESYTPSSAQGQPRYASSVGPQQTMGDQMGRGYVPKGFWDSIGERINQPNPGRPQGINLGDKDFRVAGGFAKILSGVRSGSLLGVGGGLAALAGVGKEIYDEYTGDAAASTPAAASPPTPPPTPPSSGGPLFANFAKQPVNMAMARPSEPTGLAGISSEEPAAQGGLAPGRRGDLNLSGRPFNEAYAIARQKAAELGAEKTGQFLWNGNAYQTNRAPARGDERYIPASQQTKLGELPTLSQAVNPEAPLPASQTRIIRGATPMESSGMMPGGDRPVRVFEEQGIGQPDLEYAQRYRDPASDGNNAGLIIGGPLDRAKLKDIPPELRVPVPGGGWTKPTSASAEDIYMQMRPDLYSGRDVYNDKGQVTRKGANSAIINNGQLRPPAAPAAQANAPSGTPAYNDADRRYQQYIRGRQEAETRAGNNANVFPPFPGAPEEVIRAPASLGGTGADPTSVNVIRPGRYVGYSMYDKGPKPGTKITDVYAGPMQRTAYPVNRPPNESPEAESVRVPIKSVSDAATVRRLADQKTQQGRIEEYLKYPQAIQENKTRAAAREAELKSQGMSTSAIANDEALRRLASDRDIMQKQLDALGAALKYRELDAEANPYDPDTYLPRSR